MPFDIDADLYREGASERRLDSYASFPPCGPSTAEFRRSMMTYIAFDIDTVKLLMNLFVWDCLRQLYRAIEY